MKVVGCAMSMVSWRNFHIPGEEFQYKGWGDIKLCGTNKVESVAFDVQEVNAISTVLGRRRGKERGYEVEREKRVFGALFLLASVTDPKPTPARIACSILEAIYAPDEVWGRDYVLFKEEGSDRSRRRRERGKEERRKWRGGN